MPYPAIYALTEDATQPTPSIIRSEFLNALDDAAIEGLIDGMRTPSSPTAMVQLRVLGGAMARVPAEATAFAHRTAAAMMASITTDVRGRGRDRTSPGVVRVDAPAPGSWSVGSM